MDILQDTEIKWRKEIAWNQTREWSFGGLAPPMLSIPCPTRIHTFMSHSLSEFKYLAQDHTPNRFLYCYPKIDIMCVLVAERISASF